MLFSMTRLNKDDLAQMNCFRSVGDYRDYFQSLDKKRLVEVATNLRQFQALMPQPRIRISG